MDNMRFINLTSAEKYIRENGEKIDFGVFKLKDGRLIKKYNKEKCLDRYDEFDEKNILQFKDIHIDGVSFAEALVYYGIIHGKIYATITSYISGISGKNNPFQNYQITSFMEAVKHLKVTIEKLSNLSICINDAYVGNIIYGDNRLTLIDTLEYYYSDESTDKIYEKNMMSVMKEIYRSLFSNSSLESYAISTYLHLRNNIFKNYNEKEFLMNPVEVITGIRTFLEEDFEMKLNCFRDVSPKLKESIVVSNTKVILRKR